MTLKAKTSLDNSRVTKIQADLLEPRPKKLLNSLIPVELFDDFKITCIRNKTTMTDVLIEMMYRYVQDGGF